MSNTRHYPHAPITEAVVDLRVQPRADFDPVEFAAGFGGVAGQYPKSDDIFELKASIKIGQAGVGQQNAGTTRAHIGKRFASPDGSYVLQARTTGFTLSRMRPYECWEDLRDEAMRLWPLYRAVAKPSRVTRLAVRYINKIDFSGERIELSEYLNVYPELANSSQEPIERYFMQFSSSQGKTGFKSIINQAGTASGVLGGVSVILDIDLFLDTDVPQTEEEIWAVFERLHTRENEIFESCITDKTRELFK